MKRKEVKHGLAWLMTFAMVLSMVVAAPRLSMQAEAASKKVVVKKVTAVDSLTGSKKIYLAKGKKAILKTTVTVTPNKSSNKQVKYTSSNKSVATVTSKGVITGKKVGTAKITVASKKNSKKKATVTVKVVKGKVTSVKLNQTSSTLTVGDNIKLTATVKVSSGGKKNVVWTSSDKNVATVKNGKVTAVASGNATITVKATDGTGKQATCTVTVKDKATEETTEKSTESTTTEKTTEKPAENTTEATTEKPTEEPDIEEPTQPVEKLIEASSGVFTNNKVNDCCNISGKVVTDTAYKYVIKTDSTYISNGAEGTNLDSVLENTSPYSKGDYIYICSTEPSIDKNKLLVYTDSDELKYEIKFSELYKYCNNTDTSHNVSVVLKAPIKESKGYDKEYTVGNTFTFNSKDIAVVYITTGKRLGTFDEDGDGELDYEYDSFYSFSNNSHEASSFDVDFISPNGEYDYEVEMSDGFVVTGKVTQSGVVPESERHQNLDELNDIFGTVPDPKNPTLKLSDIPSKKCESFELTISSDIDAQINFNGIGGEEYLKSAKFIVDSNGIYNYSATTADGGYTEGTIKIDCIQTNSGNGTWTPVDWNGQG